MPLAREKLLELANRRPFQPFILTLDNGDHLLVDAADALLLPARRPDRAIVFTLDGLQHTVDLEHVQAHSEP